MTERSNVITFQGNPLTLVGAEIKVGDALPAFHLTNNDLAEVTNADYAGKVLVLSIVPSIDTGVCQAQTRKFNETAGTLAGDVVILTVSMDLPFALGRFCGAEGLKAVVTASDYKDHSFGPAFGVRIKELGLLARAVFVADKSGKIIHAQYVKEVTTEPDYAAALAAVKAAL
jgi:thioredoxin-dependent peroxiredoxin